MTTIVPTSCRLALLLAGLLATAAATAGPPFVTDDPEPVDAKHWEVNYAFNGTRHAGGTQAFVPGADINYGPAEGLQLHVQLQMAYASGEPGRQYGLGDSELGLKIRLTPASEDEGAWMLSAYPILTLPSGNADRQLGQGSASLLLPLWLQTTRGPWTFYGGGGALISRDASRGRSWTGGWVALYQFTPALQLGGELYAHGSDGVDPSQTGFSVGGNYALGENSSLLFSAGRGLSHANATNTASAYLGLQVRY